MTDHSSVVAAYESLFERWLEGRSTEPALLVAARQAAMASFLRRGLPSGREELWRHAAISAVAGQAYQPVEAPVAEFDADGLRRQWLPQAYRLVFVDGTFVPDLSAVPQPLHGLAGPWSWALATRPDRTLPLLTEGLAGEVEPFSVLSRALSTDGAVIIVPPETQLELPVQLVFWSTAGAHGRGVFLRNIVLVGEGSRLTLVESFAGEHGAPRLNCPLTELRLSRGAEAETYRWVEEGDATHHVGSMRVDMQATSRLSSHTISLSGATVRLEAEVGLNAPKAECGLVGLYLPAARQSMDHRLQVHHRDVGGSSRQLFKGVLDEDGRAIFHGRVRVHPGAQKTDARQANHNLLLSRSARAHSIPQLEILADDVQCSHGATVGQLDDEALFAQSLSADDIRGLFED